MLVHCFLLEDAAFGDILCFRVLSLVVFYVLLLRGVDHFGETFFSFFFSGCVPEYLQDILLMLT